MRPAGWDPVRGQWTMVPYGPPPRPTYREPHPVRAVSVMFGIASTVVWFLVFFLVSAVLSANARSYAWTTIVAGALAWGAAALLNRYGDRGVAVGIAGTTAFGVGIVGLIVGVLYLGGDWILW